LRTRQGRRKNRDDEGPPHFILHCGKKLAHSELPGNF
jgi:hypothetical protein